MNSGNTHADVRLLLICHGHAPSDARNEFMGPRRCRGLDRAGQQHARLLGQRLAAQHLQPQVIHHIDVARAEDTANTMAAFLGHPPVLASLSCRNYGTADGALIDEIYAGFESPSELMPDMPFAEGAESWAQLTARVGRELNNIIARQGGRSTVVVCDQDTIGATFQLDRGDSPDAAQSRRSGNTGITEWQLTLEEDGDPAAKKWRGKLLRHNDVAHLPNSLGTPRGRQLTSSCPPVRA
ncbi:histidine phosphatase family protein [Nocardia sp. NPDC004168]|uniref:histidine phosphatase family protein n=1 Tax=Nocardia sp. NPDC004168 TaxID=3154452 RepID=UPI0033A7C130